MVKEGRGASHAYMLPERRKEILDTLLRYDEMEAKERKGKPYRYHGQYLVVCDAAGHKNLHKYVRKNKAAHGRAAAAEKAELRPMRIYDTKESFDVINRIHKFHEHGKTATINVRFFRVVFVFVVVS